MTAKRDSEGKSKFRVFLKANTDAIVVTILCAYIIGATGYLLGLGERVSKVESSDKHYEKSVESVNRGVEDVRRETKAEFEEIRKNNASWKEEYGIEWFKFKDEILTELRNIIKMQKVIVNDNKGWKEKFNLIYDSSRFIEKKDSNNLITIKN